MHSSSSTSWLLMLPVVVILLLGGVGRRMGTASVDAFLFGGGDAGDSAEQQTPEPVKKFTPPPGRTPRRILVFGGNGFLGAETVDRLIKLGDNVTIVNRGNWYWDSKERIAPYVDAISCDRKNGVESCNDLVQLVNKVDKFDAVIDFSAYGRKEITDAVALLQSASGDKPASSKAALYLLISTDSVYDVCEPDTRSPSGQVREIDAVRPSDPEVRRVLAEHHTYANGKLEAEEELVKQRSPPASDKPDAPKQDPTGIPYVILRLPDVLGPRDTTYRFWVYQLWIKVAFKLPRRPVVVPEFLLGYNNSFVHVDDVARTVVDIVDQATKVPSAAAAESILDEVFNLAWPQNITLDGLLRDIESVLNKDDADVEKLPFKTDGEANLYLYPTVRRGPIDSSKAVAALGWRPTEWRTAIQSTVEFYEQVIKDPKRLTQRDEIVQIVGAQLFPGNWEEREEFYTVLENLYGIDLAHFRPKREEL